MTFGVRGAVIGNRLLFRNATGEFIDREFLSCNYVFIRKGEIHAVQAAWYKVRRGGRLQRRAWRAKSANQPTQPVVGLPGIQKKNRRRSLGLRRRASTAGCVMRGSELSQKEQRWTKGQTMLAEAPSSQELAVSLALKHRNVGFKIKYRIFVSSTKKILRYICRFATGLKRH